MTFGSSGTEMGIDNSIPEVREREGNEKKTFPKLGNGKGMKKSIPKIRERERNEKNPFPPFGKAEQGHHVPVRDHEVDYGMRLGVGVGGGGCP